MHVELTVVERETRYPIDHLPPRAFFVRSMARAHPTSIDMSMTSSAALVHAAWITALVAVCLALCTIHSRKPSLFSLRRRGSSSSRSCASSRESINGDGGGTGATLAAKVSPTPGDSPKANNGGAAAEPPSGTDDDGGGPVTVIDVGTHGPIAPVFLAPDPIPPRRSLSAKHIRFAERLGRIRSMRRGSGEAAAAAAEDDVFVGLRGGDAADDDRTVLWTKTIILGERCRVPSGDGDCDAMVVPWKSYRPRQPRSVPVTRSNSFAGVGACKRADPRY